MIFLCSCRRIDKWNLNVKISGSFLDGISLSALFISIGMKWHLYLEFKVADADSVSDAIKRALGLW